MSDQVFDIEAKVADDTPKERVNTMLQSLLEDRFGLKVHREVQTRQGFALVVGKNGPKLKPAEPRPPEEPNLTQEERQAPAKAQGEALREAMKKRTQEMPISSINIATWPSVTCEELAALLVRFTEAPVVDRTGLAGEYSVTIETWKNAEVPGGTIFDAVEKLGLKPEPRKVTVETVVVDQVSRAATEN